MSLAQIRDDYHVPATLGRRVEMNGWGGVIIGRHQGSDYLQVEFDDNLRCYVHPEDLTYLKS